MELARLSKKMRTDPYSMETLVNETKISSCTSGRNTAMKSS